MPSRDALENFICVFLGTENSSTIRRRAIVLAEKFENVSAKPALD
jgi:hypothetical protein